MSSHHKCVGVSVKVWLTRRKFYLFPRSGAKAELLHGKLGTVEKKQRPYHAYMFAWLWFDIVFYLPKAVYTDKS